MKIYPIKKSFFVNGVHVELIKLKEDAQIGAKVYAKNDEIGLLIYKYLCKEGMLRESFLLTDNKEIVSINPS